MRKIAVLMIMILLLSSVLAACGKNNSTESSGKRDDNTESSRERNAEESFQDAENGFHSAADDYLEAQNSLRTYISEAEELLDIYTEENVDNPDVLENLRKILENAKGAVEMTMPEMGKKAYEIRQQTWEISEQTDSLWSLWDDLENAVLRVWESHEKYEEANRSGIVVMKASFGSQYTYNSTGTFKFVPFTVTLDIIDPETGEISNLKTFSSKETHSCSAGFGGGLFGYSISNNTTAARSYFNSDLTKMVATLTLEDGAVHIGYIDERGGFTDVSKEISVTSDFDGITNHSDPTFWGNYLYFKDFTDETVRIKRVPLDNLAPDAVEILVEDVTWKGGGVYPYVDGSIHDSASAVCEYYDESMTYAANTNFFNDWISESECVGTDDGMIYKYNLAGEYKNLAWYSEATPLVPEIKGRKNWNAIVSPECNRVAFLSKLTTATGAEQNTMLYIVSIDGGEPVRVNTAYDFSDPDEYHHYVSLINWLEPGGQLDSKNHRLPASKSPSAAHNSSAASDSARQPAPTAEPAGATQYTGFTQLTIIGAQASSQLPEQYGNTYEAEHVLDNNTGTAWAEGVPGDGQGEWIQVSLDREQVVSAVGIINGYAKSQSLYQKNVRAKKVRLEFSDGSSQEIELQDGRRDLQKQSIIPVSTSYVKMTILEVYAGDKYSDLCIGQIACYQ